ncbi:MAG: DUF480 domain-containing protein [Nocardioides sp.]|nr:DUF480 domain-containing protein [Nocardioides sp.]
MAEAPELPVLDATEQRVLGCLLEKEVTVPGSYPMTVNSIRLGCNQTSSREPVVDYDDRVVHETLRGLKQQDLVGVTWQDSGRRTMKYVHRVDAVLGVSPAQRALLTVLLLRGPQAPGAHRSRTERLHGFADRAAVEVELAAMAAAEPPLVRELDRQVGQQDSRWVHLLGPVDPGLPGAGPVVPGVDRDVVIADGPQARDERVRASYDTIAPAYAEHLVDELADLPFETWLLDRVVALAGGAPVVEVGCGPGHVTAHLAARGAAATGIDLSPGMVAEARRRFPAGHYEVGDLRRLMRPVDADGWGAVLGWYSLIHLAAAEVPAALEALLRPLRTDGWLVLALHAGAQVRHLDTWFEREVCLDMVLHEPADVVAWVAATGLIDVEWFHRGPLAHRGETSQRLYVLARKPA